jgi:hypothetical protein
VMWHCTVLVGIPVKSGGGGQTLLDLDHGIYLHW